jgi:hypothetical protein
MFISSREHNLLWQNEGKIPALPLVQRANISVGLYKVGIVVVIVVVVIVIIGVDIEAIGGRCFSFVVASCSQPEQRQRRQQCQLAHECYCSE